MNVRRRTGMDRERLLLPTKSLPLPRRSLEALFALVPKGTLPPDLIPEADGEICISWSVDTDRLLSLSVGAHGKINFAGRFGKEGGIHGWQPIDATSPSALDESLQEVAKYLGGLYPPTASERGFVQQAHE